MHCYCGMGGLGKTTIAQQIFNDPEVCKRFQTIRLTVSKNFSKCRISTCLLKNFGGEISEESDGNLIKALTKASQKKEANYLVVMDDVWSMDVDWWPKFCYALTVQNKSIRILVTTRDKNVTEKVVFR